MKPRWSSIRPSLAAAVLVFAVLGTACGDASRGPSLRPVVHADEAVTARQVAAVTANDAAPLVAKPRADVAGSEVGGPSPARPAAAPTTATPTATAAAAESVGLPLTVSVDPACAVAGQSLTVHLSSAPRASFAMAVSFADDQAHGLMAFADADEAGRFAWTVVIPPDVPAGEATVLVGAREPAGGNDVGATAPFLVSEGGCR